METFFLDRTEVTAGDYQRCVDLGACSPVTRPEGLEELCNPGDSTRINHPANCLTFIDAMAYCASVQKRLPSEDEWERAARSNGGPYPWGSQEPDCGRVVFNPTQQLTGLGCETGRTWPVGSLPNGATSSGIMDLSGNITEWVLAEPEGARRVGKGGNFIQDRANLHPGSRQLEGAREFQVPTNAPAFGFRCAKDL